MSLDKQITIGMSGHIDHGKTSIVKAITGKNTDSLKQEREGYDYRYWICFFH